MRSRWGRQGVRGGLILTALALVLVSCDTGLGAKVDVTAPKVAITSPTASGGYFQGTLSLKGTATDDLGVASVTLTFVGQAGAPVTKAASLAGTEWALDVATGAGGELPEGRVAVTVEVSDSSGKTATDSTLIYIDNVTPTVLITYPLSHGPSDNALPRFTDTIDIKGEVFDRSPLTRVEVSLVDSAGAVIASKIADGTNTWSARFPLKGSLPLVDGSTYYYTVLATDSAGNSNGWYFSASDIYSVLPANTAFPTISELGTLEEVGSGVSASGIDFGAFSGKKMGGNTGKFGDFRFVATALPTVAFSNLDATKPANVNILGPGTVISGNIIPPVNTGAIDLSSIEIKIYRAADFALGLPALVTILDTDPDTENDNVKITSLGDSQGFTIKLRDGTTPTGGAELTPGEYRISVKSKSSGSQTGTLVAAFFIDAEAPTLTETEIGNGSLFTNVPFLFKGLAASSLGIKSITIFESRDFVSTNSDSTLNYSATDTTVNWLSPLLPAVTGAPDGTYGYEIRLEGQSGKTSSVYRTITYDKTPPEVSINGIKPLIGSNIVSGANVEVTFGASDSNGVSEIRWWALPSADVAPAWTTTGFVSRKLLPYTGAFDSTSFVQGTYKIWLAGLDKAGNTNLSTALDVVIDQAPPVLAFAPTPPATMSASGAAAFAGFAGTASDSWGLDSTAPVVMTYTKSGVAQTAATIVPAAGSWSKPFPIDATSAHSSDGVYNFTFTAKDLAGRTSVINHGLTVDTRAPVVTVATPSANGLVASPPMVSAGNSDDGAGVGGVKTWVRVDTPGADHSADVLPTGWTAATDGFLWSANVPLGAEGHKKFWVKSQDAYGNLSTLSSLFDYDQAPPVLTETNRTNTQFTTNGTISFAGTATDTNALQSLTLSATLNGAPVGTLENLVVTPGTGAWTYTKTADSAAHADDGLWVFTLTATDIASRTTVLTRTVLVDTKAPVSTIDPFESSYYEATLPASGTADDGNGSVSVSGLQKVEYSVDSTNGSNGNWLTANGSSVWNRSADISGVVPVGTHTLWVRAADKAGNVGTSVAASYTIDRSLPSISETSYATTEYRSATFSFSVDILDDLSLASSNALTVSLKVNNISQAVTGLLGSPATNSGRNQNWTFSVPVSYGDGTYEIVLGATDGVGRAAQTITRTVIVDRTAPSFSVSNLVANDLITSSSLTILGTATDGSGSGVASVSYKLDGASTWTPATGNTNWVVPVSSLSDGLSHTIDFQAIDNAGNVSAVTTISPFKIDTALPNLAVTTPGFSSSTLVLKDTAVVLTGPATDANGVTKVSFVVTKDGTPIVVADDTNNDGSWSYAVPFASDGTQDGVYEIAVTATDGALRQSVLTRRIQLDTKSPDLTVTSPLETELIATASYTLRGQVTDNGGSGVTSLAYSRTNGSYPGASWTEISNTGLNWSKSGVNFSAPVGAETIQGARTLYVRTADAIGHAVTKTIQFNYDTEDPTLAETTSGLGTTLVNRKTAVNFGGSSGDTNRLDTVKFSINGGTAVEVTDTNLDGNAATRFDSWSYTLPNSTQGSYTIVFTATDVAGRSTSLSRNVLIDTTAPTTPAFTTSAGLYVTTSLAIAGTTGDASGSGVQTVFYRLDGTSGDAATGTLTGTDDWFGTLNIGGLGLGNHSISVWSTDRALNKSAEQVQNFVVDRADPTISSPSPVTQGTNANLSLTGTASDDVLMATITASYSKDGNTAVVVSPTGTATAWSIAVPVSNGSGSYVYTVTATDSVGRTKSLTRTVVIDTQAPTSAISNIASNGSTVVNGSSYTVTGTAVDVGLSGLASVEYSLDSGSTWIATTGTGSWIVPLTGLSDGLDQTFWLKVIDNSGNAANQIEYTFDVDLAAPTFTETTSTIPSASVVYKNANVTFGGNASDGNNLASIVVSATKNGSAIADRLNVTNPSNGTWTASLPTSLGDGAYELTFTATDKVGKVTSFVRNVVIDTTAPTLLVTGPAANELVSSTSFIMSGQVTDNGGKGVTTLEYSRDNSNWSTITPTGLSWTKTVDFSLIVGAEAAQGARTVYLRATDDLNSYTTQTIGFFYDTDNPVVLESTSGFTTSLENKKAAVLFGGTATDTNAMSTVKVSLNGVDQGTVTNTGTAYSTWTYTLPATPGTYAIVFTATDVAGRTSTTTRNVVIDTTAPTTPVFTSSAGAYVTNSLPIAGTAGDGSGSGVQTAYYRLDGIAGGAATGTLTGTDDWFSTLNVSGLAEGAHTVSVWTVDRATNKSAEADQSFVVDRNDPTLTPNDAVSQNTKLNVSLTGTASDANALTSVTAVVRKNGGAPSAATVVGTSSWSISVLTSMGDGSYAYTVTALDTVGRSTSVTRTVVIDTTAPTITVSNPANLAVVSDADLSVSGIATDALSGVTLVEYRLNGGSWTALTGTGNWNGTVALGAEGTKTLDFRSTDALSTTSTVSTVTINLDLTPPSLAETGVGATSPKRSADFALSGTASDTNGLASWDADGDDADNDGKTDASGNTLAATPRVPYVEVSTDGGTTKTKVTVSGGTWSYNFTVPSDGSADGDKNFIVYATDSVNKITTLSRTVTVDATAPVIAVDGVIAGLNVSTNSVNGVITFRFSANDAGVGLERPASTYKAYYAFVADGASPPADMTTWSGSTSASTVFSFTVDTSSFGTSGNQAMDLWVGVRDGVLGGSNVPNVATVKTDLTVNQDSNRPVLSIDNMNMAAASNSINGFGQNPTVLLTIEDDDAVSVAQLQYRIDANNDGDFGDVVELGTAANKWEDESVWNAVEEVPATDRSLAQAKIKLTGFPQGAFRLQVRSRDTSDVASWASIFDVNTNFSWSKSPIIRFAVDFGPPTIAVTAPLAGTYNADFTLSGTAGDALGVISVDYTLNGGSTYTNVFTNAGGATSAPFSVSVDADVLPTGEYILQVEATDFGGTTATQQIPITIDRTAPTVTVLQPGLHATLNGASVVVRGEASDNRQLGAVFLWHGKVSDPDPAVLPSRTGPGTYASGSYSAVTGTSSWNTTIDTTGTVSTATDGYRIRMVGVDSIGNVSTPTDYLVKIDQTSDKPVIGFSNLVVSGLPTPSRLALGNLSIIGTASDDDSVKATGIQIRIDRNGDSDFDDTNETYVAVSQPPASNSLVVSWVHEITDLFSEGLHHVQVRALDTNDVAADYTTGYGWSESTVVPFMIDNGPPALEVATPTLGQRFSVNSFTLTGTTQDTNGINRVVVWVDNNENTLQEGGELTTITGPLTTDNTVYNISQTISGLTDGTKTVRVSSYDSSNALTIRELTVVIDTTAPTATISTPSAASTVNGTISLIGTATDNYQVSKVYWNLSLTASGAPAFVVGAAAGQYHELVGQTYAWNTSVDTTTYSDGAYTLRVVVLDSAGNNSSGAPASVAFAIDQTTDRPIIDVLTVEEAGTAIANLLPPSLAISGTVQDDDAVDKTKIQVHSRLLPGGSFSGWTNVSGQPASNSSLAIWSHTFTGFTDGQYEFEIRAADVNDTAFGTNSSAASVPVKFSVDLSLPTGSVSAPAQASFHSTNVAVNGTSADASGIKKVSIAFDSGGGYGAESVLYNDLVSSDGYVTPYAWSTSYAVSNGDAQVFFRVTITDAFDKVRTLEQYFTVDTQGPTTSFLLPAAAATLNGSVLARGTANDGNQVSAVYFKVNNQTGPGTWATGDPTTNGWTLLAGKYNWEQRFTSASLTDGAARIYLMAFDAAGNRSDPTNVANQLDFTVNQAANKPVVTISTPNNALLDNSGTIQGTITDDDSVDSSTVQINLGAGWVNVTSASATGPTVSFTHSLAGLTQRSAAYTVQVRASDTGEDFAGTADDIAAVASDVPSISIKKDDGDPTIGITNLNNGLLTVTTLQGVYLKDKLTLTGTATDGVQVASVQARLPGIAGAGAFTDVAVSNTGTNFSTWSWTLTGLTLPGTTVNLEVKVTDVNGRSTTTAYTLLVDTVAPSVTIETPATNPDTTSGAYNGSLVFRGAASDLVKVESVYYKWGTTAAAAPAGNYGTWTQAGSTYSWTTSAFDSTITYSDALDHTYHLSVVSVDSAGNESTVQDLVFTINQGSDRPVIVLSQPTAAQVLETNAKTTGSAADDDGLASVELRVDLNNDGDFADLNEGYLAVTIPAVVSGKSQTFENTLAALADGFYKLQVRVRDSGYAAAAVGLKTFHETETTVTNYSIDKSPPTLSLSTISIQHRYGGATTVVSSGFNGSYVNNDFTLRFNATDSSGIASVETSLDNVTYTPATFISGSSYDSAIPISALADGTRSVYYRATDNNAKVTSGLLTLIVDKTIPVVSFQSPSGIFKDDAVSNAPNVNGTAVTVSGSVTDGSSISSLALVGGVSDNVVLSNTTGNNTSWSVTFNATTYANATYAVETGSGTNVWRLPIKVTAYDAAGMRTINTGYVDLDPDGDKPIGIISTPAPGASVTGIITLNGTMTDDDGTSGTVDIGLDTDNNGTFTDQVFTNVAVSNGAWSQQINNSGTLSGTISFRVTPRDINGKLGDLQQRSIFIDASLPSIVGYNGSSVLTAPTPSTGTKQKGTITIRALFQDDDVIPAGNLQVSLDGGTTYGALSLQPGYSINQLADFGGKKRYDVQFTVNTASYFADHSGTGSASVILQITDNTYKPAVVSLNYAVDNRPPEITWDPLATLTAPQAGVYSFSGSGLTNLNKLIGTAVDGGAVSGVSSVSAYFVKNGFFRDPKLSGGSTTQTLAVAGDGLYTLLPFTAIAVNTTSEMIDLDRTATNPAALGGTVNNALPVRFVGASLPGGLDANTLYYVRDAVGSTFRLSVSPSDNSRIDLGTTGSGAMSMEYALYGIPYTSDLYLDSSASGHYGIQIDKRTELGSNDGNANGDGDGFQESLKDGGGYDDWFTYFDTTKLPDGPLDLYQVVTDTSGNKVVSRTVGQIINNPPSLTGVTVNSTAATSWKVKTGTAPSVGMDVVLTATDSGTGANIAASGWKLEVLARYGNGTDISGSADATYTGWFYGTGGVRTFSATGSGTTLPVTATVAIFPNGGGLGQESSFTNNYWYQLRGTATDTDGNVATQIFYLKINNGDVTPPVLRSGTVNNAFDDFSQASLIAGHLEIETLRVTAEVTTAAGDKLSFTSASLVGTSTVAAGQVVYLPNGESRTISTFTSGTGTIAWTGALTNPLTVGALAVITPAPPAAGGMSFTGTVGTTGATSVIVPALANNPFVAAGWTIVFANGEWRTIGTFTKASGTVAWTTALNTNPTVSAALRVIAPAQVSGSIKITGKAFDDTDVNTVTVEISENGGSSYPTTIVATKSNQTGNAVNGYSWDWTANWTTTSVTGGALRNVLIRVYATDTSGNSTLVGNRPVKSVDVVPYITTITDPSGVTDQYILRGSQGKYSIMQHATNTLTVSGFNLSGTGLVKISTSATDWTTGTPLSYSASGGSSTAITVSKSAANLSKSGFLTLVVNGVSSNNNVNDNTQTVNIEKKLDPRSSQWTDDRSVWVWANSQVTSVALSNPSYPDMVMNPTNTNFPVFSYAEDIQAELWYATTTNDSTFTGVRRSGNKLQRNAVLSWPASATLPFIISTNDATRSNSLGYLEILGYQDAGGVAGGALATNLETSSGVATGGAGAGGVRTNWLTIQGEDNVATYTNRFLYPKLLSAQSTTTSVNQWVTYFDAYPGTTAIKFVALEQTARLTSSNFTQAGASGALATGVGTPIMTIPGTGSGQSSQYYSMARVGTTGAIAIAYYDPTTFSLKLQYASNAYTVTGAAAATNLSATWAATALTVDSSADVGQHVSMVYDGTGKLYLAYYDYTNSDLKFARVTWNGSGTPTVDGILRVDSFLSTGSWTNIKLTNSGVAGATNQPYISYYSDSYIGSAKPLRYAYPNFDATAPTFPSTKHGVVNDGSDATDDYTGNWEVMAVPTTVIPKGGAEQFAHTMHDKYVKNGMNVPIVAWLGAKIEYGKLQPNN